MKHFCSFITAVLLLSANQIKAQDLSTYYNKMDTIFQHLDRTKVVTGLLGDYGIAFIDFSAFNGILSDTNYVNIDTWKMLYSSIYSCKFGHNASLNEPSVVNAAIDDARDNAVALMHFHYQTLNEAALDLGYVTVINEQIIPIENTPLPYVNKELFAIAPKQLYFEGPTVTLDFPQNLRVGNPGKTIQKIEVNFNNESGFLQVVDNSVSYLFGSNGQKTIIFRVTYTDGISCSSHTNISVAKGYTPTLGHVRPQSIHPSYNVSSTDIPINPSYQHAGGTMQILYHNTSKTISKPLIIAEGFDPPESNGKGTIDLDYLMKKLDSIFVEGQSLTDLIGDEGYDIIYLDYNNGADDIWKNAALFKEVIEYVNDHKAPDTSGVLQKNVVMGISMGGLVASIALKQMEKEGLSHQTWKFFSMDTPHKGANVPVGLQAMVRDFYGLSVAFLGIPIYQLKDEPRMQTA